MKRTILFLALFSLAASLFSVQSIEAQSNRRIPAVIWQDPGDIRARDLRYGPGSAALAPAPPFKFLEEDKDGESPKFDVKDARNVRWKVKLGPESQSETVATRLVWAVGYFAEEAYYFDKVRIENLPKLSRGREYVKDDHIVMSARFEPRRPGVKRGDTWDWNKNPFIGTKMLNGLKVLMIMLNNYDARTENNRVLLMQNRQRNRLEAYYVVTDLGATLGRAGGLGGGRSKNDLDDFLSTRFVLGVKNGEVEFDFDTRPKGLGTLSILYPPYYKGEVKKEKDMRGIPLEHARWIGGLLGQLSDDQIRDAFRAAGYDTEIMEGFIFALRIRTNELTRL